MALTISGFPDFRAVLGPSMNMRAYQMQPAASDYPTGGYVINASNVDLSELFGAWLITQLYATSMYIVQFCLPSSSYGASPAPKPATTINMVVLQSAGSAAPPVEIANGTDISAFTFDAVFIGY